MRTEHITKHCLLLTDERSTLLPFRKAAEDGEEVPMIGDVQYGRGHRRTVQSKRMRQSDTEDEEPNEDHAGSAMLKITVFAS